MLSLGSTQNSIRGVQIASHRCKQLHTLKPSQFLPNSQHSTENAFLCVCVFECDIGYGGLILRKMEISICVSTLLDAAAAADKNDDRHNDGTTTKTDANECLLAVDTGRCKRNETTMRASSPNR